MVKSVGKILAGTVLGAGIALSLQWTGTTNLAAAKTQAEQFKKAAVEYVAKVKELEQYAGSLSEQNTELTDKVAELEEKIAELKPSSNDNKVNLGQAKKQLDKANKELEKANKEAKEHEADMMEILDVSIFE